MIIKEVFMSTIRQIQGIYRPEVKFCRPKKAKPDELQVFLFLTTCFSARHASPFAFLALYLRKKMRTNTCVYKI